MHTFLALILLMPFSSLPSSCLRSLRLMVWIESPTMVLLDHLNKLDCIYYTVFVVNEVKTNRYMHIGFI
jgi:hypothetical protein